MEEPECWDDSDCGECSSCEDGYCYYDSQDPICNDISEVIAWECDGDAECEEGQVCEDWMCVWDDGDIIPECATDSDCGECTTCLDEICVALPGCTPGCKTDADCGIREICIATPGQEPWTQCVSAARLLKCQDTGGFFSLMNN